MNRQPNCWFKGFVQVGFFLFSLLPSSLLFSQTLEIHHINVSQGDSTLIIVRNLPALKANLIASAQVPNAVTMNWMPQAIANKVPLKGTVASALLIDGGDQMFSDDVLNYAIEQGVTGNAVPNFYVIGTHYHADHVGGLLRLYKDYTGIPVPSTRMVPTATVDPQTVPVSGGSPVVSYYTNAKFAQANYAMQYGHPPLPGNLPLTPAAVTTPIQVTFLAYNGNVQISAMGGTQYVIPKANEAEQNAKSVVGVLQYGQFKYFFGGDIAGSGQAADGNTGNEIATPNVSYTNIEKYLRPLLASLYPATVGRPQSVSGHICGFKTNHHGSATSNDVYFLSTIMPCMAVNSSGVKARFHGLPSQPFLNRLAAPTWAKEGVGVPVANSISRYFITEIAQNGIVYRGKVFNRTLGANAVVGGDIIVRPFDQDVAVPGPIRMLIYATGVSTHVTGDIAVVPPVKSNPLGPLDPINGPWVVTCNMH